MIDPQVGAKPDQTVERAHPVVLTPTDPADVERLAVAINAVKIRTGVGAVLVVGLQMARRVLAALAADDTVDACIWCGCPTTGDTRRTAEHAVAQLAHLDGVTVTRGPDGEPWHPGIASPAAPPRTDRSALERANADRQRLAGAAENLRGDVRVMAQQRDQWIARAVKAEDALTRICADLRTIADEHDPAGDDPPCYRCGHVRGEHRPIDGHLYMHPRSPAAKALQPEAGGRSDG